MKYLLITCIQRNGIEAIPLFIVIPVGLNKKTLLIIF